MRNTHLPFFYLLTREIDRFSSVETPLAPHPPPADAFSPAPTDGSRFDSVPPNPTPSSEQTPDYLMHDYTYDQPQPQPTQPTKQSRPHPPPTHPAHPPPHSLQQNQPTQQQQQQQQQQQLMATNTGGSGAQTPEVLQAAFAQMLQSPTQMQRLLSALAAQTMNPAPESMPAPPPEQVPFAPQHQPYQQSQQTYQQQIQPYTDYRGFEMYAPPAPAPAPAPPTADIADQFASLGLPAQDSVDTRLQKTYRDTAEIEADVNTLNSSINSLIQSLGLDAEQLQAAERAQAQGAVDPHDTVLPAGASDMGSGAGAADFDFASFLFPNGDGAAEYAQYAERLDGAGADGAAVREPSPAQLSAIMDEAAGAGVADGGADPLHYDGTELFAREQQAKRGAKRKSDVAELPAGGFADDMTRSSSRLNGAQQTTTTGTKSKRKK